MQRNEFETMVKELLPDVTEQAMEKWTQYAQELEQDAEDTAAQADSEGSSETEEPDEPDMDAEEE